MRVIGTAGHVDHGKSTLVRALTGIDPDRLREEKEREMTIDLGFAWLTLPNGEPVGVVDVPGHIDFIKNMLAGVGGIDAALFVVAADEGVMPQTREHLAILDLLQVPAGVVALTKIDMVTEEDWLELVQAELREVLSGTMLSDASIVPVSARTGEGLPLLLQAIEDVLDRVPARPDRGQPRLPIDRAFSVAGFGTVVTGTLTDGQLRVGDEVEVVPGNLRARVRGLQSHKLSLQVGQPGSRLAVNLSGVHPDQLARGRVVARPGSLRPTSLVDVHVRMARGGSTSHETVPPLEHNQTVDFFTGAAEVPARVRLLDAEQIGPAESGWAQLRLDEPVALAAGDHFIIRQPSPSRTLGGGVVTDPHPARRWRRFQSDVIARLETLRRGSPEDLLLHPLSVSQPATLRSLADRSGLDAEPAETALSGLVASGQIVPLGTPLPPLASSSLMVMSLRGWQQLGARSTAILREYHSQYPLRSGMPREELKSRLQGQDRWPAKLFNEVVALATKQGILLEAGETLALPGHRPTFTPEQLARVEQLLAAFRRQPYAPPSMAEAIGQVGAEVVNALVNQGTLVRLNDEVLLLVETHREMRERVVAHMRQNGSITVAQVRDLFATSRKYALALVENLDEQKVTRRVGDERVLR